MTEGTNDHGSDSDEDVNWYEDDIEGTEDQPIKEYEVTAAPNDFNIKTIFDFIESGAVKIPGFQRHFVWDIKRASKLVESIIIGLPIPQIFLYEESRNSFLVIDGQQRLMSIYYFMKQRFPRKEKRTALREYFYKHGNLPEEIIHNDELFTKFNLQLSETLPNQPNKFNKLNYATLGEYKTTFDLRTIRNVIIKQTSPPGDDSAIYEIFNRLNSGGVNLKPQEIRTSLYHSAFYEMLYRINLDARWRKMIRLDHPDLHMKDTEILLRAFAMLTAGVNYNPSMTKFINGFSKSCKNLKAADIEYFEKLCLSFFDSCKALSLGEAFLSKRGRFNISLFEAVFAAVCRKPLENRELVTNDISPTQIANLQADPEFVQASQSETARKKHVDLRLRKAREIFGTA
jgi:uncharacterized protein with ParB-like and HNH nuclease domain